MLTLSDEHHTVMSGLCRAGERKSSLSKGLCFCERYVEGSGVKWNEVVWMDGRQSGVQKDRLGNFE